MGQAKNRGDFETRKQQAIERREVERQGRIAELEAQIERRRQKSAVAAVLVAGLIAGATR